MNNTHTPSDISIRRTLISVSNKTELLPLAQALTQYDCEIISTGGTARLLKENGISFTPIQEITGSPEAFGGRMKTLSFQIGSALLYDRERDASEAATLGITPIDLVVCNLYPFQEKLESGADFSTLIEHIDIGGPTMIRAAAKNYQYVAVVTDPNDYASLIEELHQSGGALSLATRKSLMQQAFNHTADYDAVIATKMDQELGKPSLRLTFDQIQTLRYGENAHQTAQLYRERTATYALADLEVLHGKALSFNNILDINGAIEAVRGFEAGACAVVKHNNPCGLASGSDQRELLAAAWAGDPISAFGSIVAFNRPVNKDTVTFFRLDAANRAARKFIEVVVAPSYSEEALAYLRIHKNLRVIVYDFEASNQAFKDLRYMDSSLLVQDKDEKLYDKLKSVTKKTAAIASLRPLITFGIRAICSIKSNAIVIVREKDGILQLLGMGAGQPNRLIATKLAIEKSKANLQQAYSGPDLEGYIQTELAKAVLISDAFFPFADNVELAAAAGIRLIVQPGGSIRDKEVIAKCDDLDVAMIFTGLRHFRH